MNRNLKTLFSLICLYVMSMGFAFSQDISNALKSGNVNELKTYLAAQIDLSIGDDEDLLSKQEAVKRLNAFFSTNNPSGFNIVHEGKSASGLAYSIGELKTDSGVYRVSYYYDNKNGKTIIRQLMIDSGEK